MASFWLKIYKFLVRCGVGLRDVWICERNEQKFDAFTYVLCDFDYLKPQLRNQMSILENFGTCKKKASL